MNFAPQVGNAFIEIGVRQFAETHQHTRDRWAGVGQDKADVRNPTYGVLQWVGNEALNLFRGGARHVGRDIDPVEVNFWILLARHGAVAQHTQTKDHNKRDVCQRVVGDEALIKTHGVVTA